MRSLNYLTVSDSIILPFNIAFVLLVMHYFV
jgi:hypothetical protein